PEQKEKKELKLLSDKYKKQYDHLIELRDKENTEVYARYYNQKRTQSIECMNACKNVRDKYKKSIDDLNEKYEKIKKDITSKYEKEKQDTSRKMLEERINLETMAEKSRKEDYHPESDNHINYYPASSSQAATDMTFEDPEDQ